MLLRAATLIALAAVLIPAAPKNREWQTGTALDAEDNIYFGRTNSHSQNTTISFGDPRAGSQLQVGTRSPGDDFVMDQFVVESETTVYLVQAMRPRASKPYRLAANLPVKFAVEKKKFWLLDSDGHEHQANIAKQKEKLQPTQ